MDHYDEKMNYSFEPVAPETPQPPLEQAKEEIRRSGKHTGLKIAALLAAVAIVAGVGGSALTKAIDAIGQKNLAEQESSASVGAMAEQSVEQEQPAAQKPQADASYRLERTPLPETLKSNEGDKALTPAQVYKMNIGAVCGISTQVTASLWGVETTGVCTGSGFVLTADGYIVTNNHVVADADEGTVVVQFYSSEEYPAVIIGTDSMNDVALLKIEAEGLQTVTVGDSDEVEVGETVEAIGNPLGDLTFTMTAGYISALDREIDADGTPINMLQTDVAINAGNSGGGMFNVAGELVGVPSMKYTGSYYSTSTVEGIGMAIPINVAKPLIEEVLSGKTVANGASSADSTKDSSSVAPESRPRMGVKVKTISASNSGAVAAGALPSGAYIDEVEKNSPAEKAGLQVKDIVVEVDGTIVSSSKEMVNAMASKKAGDTVEIKYFRMEGDESKWESYDDIQGDYHTVTVELAMLDETHS